MLYSSLPRLSALPAMVIWHAGVVLQALRVVVEHLHRLFVELRGVEREVDTHGVTVPCGHTFHLAAPQVGARRVGGPSAARTPPAKHSPTTAVNIAIRFMNSSLWKPRITPLQIAC